MDNATLRELTRMDLPMVLTWRNNLEVRKYMYTQHEISLSEHTNWFESLDSNNTKYYICEIDNIPIGVVNFTNLKNSNRQAMWGFYSGDLSRRGVGKTMETVALNHAFTKLNLEKLNCEVLSNNMSVVNFHRKFGFSVEGIFKDHFVTSDNEILDIYRLSLTRDNWTKSQLNETGLKIGKKYAETLTVTPEMVNNFSKATGDLNPIHFSQEAAQAHGFSSPISHGILPLGLISKILGMNFPGEGTIYVSQTTNFLKPVLVNSKITICIKIITIVKRKVVLSTEVLNSENEICISGEATVLAPRVKND